MIFALQDASTSYSAALGRICGFLFLVALVIAVLQALFTGKRIFSSHAKYILVVLVLIVGGILALIYAHRSSTTTTSPSAGPPTIIDTPTPQHPAISAVKDSELDRLLAEAQRQYSTLEKQRTSLDTKNTKAVKAFNQQASAYKELLNRIEERRKAKP